MIRARFGKTAAGRLLLGAGVLALLIPAVVGCEAGEDAPTLEYHPASAGAQADFNGIKITNAFVLGGPSGSTVPSGSSASLFVSLYNGSGASDSLVSASASGAAERITLDGGSVALPVNSAPVNLTGPAPKAVLENLTKPLSGGTSVPVTFDFKHAGSVTLEVPVEAQSYYYSTYSPPAATPNAGAAVSTSTATPPPGASVPSKSSGTAQPSGTPTAQPTRTVKAAPTASTAP